jgi:hypothetical protein
MKLTVTLTAHSCTPTYTGFPVGRQQFKVAQILQFSQVMLQRIISTWTRLLSSHRIPAARCTYTPSEFTPYTCSTGYLRLVSSRRILAARGTYAFEVHTVYLRHEVLTPSKFTPYTCSTRYLNISTVLIYITFLLYYFKYNNYVKNSTSWHKTT